MEIVYILLTAIIVLAAVNIILLLRRNDKLGENEKLNVITKRLEGLEMSGERMRETVDTKLENVHRAGQSQFRETREIINEITLRSDRLINNVNKRLGDLDKTNQRIVDFSAQLQHLQNILQNPKQRGVFGEVILEQVLSNVLPPETFQMQYAFSNNNIVDAAVFVKEKVIPIDSKFSLENYNRLANIDDPEERAQMEKVFINDLKLRIQETSKYILPEEGTTDFAFMFIPSESIYYDLLTNTVGTENLIHRAVGQYKVIIVSPTSFLAYLQTVVQGLKSMEIEERAQDIIKNVEKLSKHLDKYEVSYHKLGKTLGTVVNHYEIGYKEFGKIDKDITKITGENIGIDKLDLEKPQIGDE
ncbi:MAG: DNA recombination protein RmuC [Candidatus Moraniibacteriota bacterium]|nr:MAG: DNA recombination protein RmuC [Candidatus Moranbacteria bacterium]